MDTNLSLREPLRENGLVPAISKIRLWLPRLAVAITALALTRRLFLLVNRYAVNIFFSDQWEFNTATVFQSHTLWDIFTWQHGPHRQGLGGVLAKLIEPHFQWDSRIEAFLIAGLFVAGAALAVWLKYRLFGEIDYYDVLIPSLLLTATQCEVILGAANFAHGSLPLLLVVLYCLAWTVKSPITRFAAVLFVNFLLIFTGFGLLMGFLTPLVILASWWTSRGDTRAVQLHVSSMGLAVLSLGLFFVGYKWNPAVDCYDSVLVSHSLIDYFHFAALMCANYLGLDSMSSKYPAVWGNLVLLVFLAMLAAIVVSAIRLRKPQTESNVAPVVTLILLAFSLAFCSATARGRLCLGFAAAQESRYMPYLTPAFLGGYFFLNRLGFRRWLRHAAMIAWLALCIFASWPLHRGDQLELAGFHAAKLRWKTCYLATKNIARCNRETGVKITNSPEQPNLQQKLDFLDSARLNLFNGR